MRSLRRFPFRALGVPSPALALSFLLIAACAEDYVGPEIVYPELVRVTQDLHGVLITPGDYTGRLSCADGAVLVRERLTPKHLGPKPCEEDEDDDDIVIIATCDALYRDAWRDGCVDADQYRYGTLTMPDCEEGHEEGRLRVTDFSASTARTGCLVKHARRCEPAPWSVNDTVCR